MQRVGRGGGGGVGKAKRLGEERVRMFRIDELAVRTLWFLYKNV